MNDLLEKNIGQFTHLTSEEFQEIKRFFRIQEFNKGDFMIKENDNVSSVYFILTGLVKLSYWDDKAKEHIISFAMEDWWETDFTAFYNGSKATFTLYCMEPTTVYSLSLDNYKKICSSFPFMVSYFLDKSIKGHIANQKRIVSVLALNPREKYEHFLQLYPTLIQRVPKSILAAYLGVSRETLSRLYSEQKTK